ncbi:MAG TPA: outer membrane protein [Pseudolabrys sp.]|jgi:outer membrane immunogenic protein|nr:outer membrane protein [Pseudolabrys sp.]
MKRLTLTAIAGLLAAAWASPSVAADMPRPAYKAPVYVAPAFSWTGFYLGINGGYGWAKSDWSSAATSGSVDTKGWLIGGTLGYNMQTGVWVWGLEGDVDLSTIKGSTTGGTGVCGGTGCETRNRWFGTARGRIGYSFDRWLPYITGGAAFGDVKMSPNTGVSETKTKIGWTVGAGVEWAFTDHWSTKIEYLYADLGKSTCSAATCGVDTDVTFKANIVRLGVNYRF